MRIKSSRGLEGARENPLTVLKQKLHDQFNKYGKDRF